MKILIVEDNPQNMKFVATVLMRAGYEVLTAMEADRAIMLAREELPDLILMDIQLPGMDGLTAARLLKEDSATWMIPIIAVTACAMVGDRERIIAAGCDDYMSKPFSYTEFLAMVQRWIPLDGD